VIAELLVLAALLKLDPSGDAHGAGELQPPTAALYASVAPFDLIQVEVLDAPTLTVRVTFAERANPLGLPNGISLPILEVYLDVADGGHTDLLPGSGLVMPSPHGWDVAFRVDGDDAFVVIAGAEGDDVFPIEVRVQGDALELVTMLAPAANIRRVDAITGVYDPFSLDGWRGVTVGPSPWAFSSTSPAPPVIDVLAPDAERQNAALERFELPREGTAIPPSTWLTLSMIGVVLVIAGYGSRGRTGRGTLVDASHEDASVMDSLLIGDDDLSGLADEPGPEVDEDALIDVESISPDEMAASTADVWSFPVTVASQDDRVDAVESSEDASLGEERVQDPSIPAKDSQH